MKCRSFTAKTPHVSRSNNRHFSRQKRRIIFMWGIMKNIKTLCLRSFGQSQVLKHMIIKISHALETKLVKIKTGRYLIQKVN